MAPRAFFLRLTLELLGLPVDLGAAAGAPAMGEFLNP